ncbi:MAG: penicillin-binding transpeptidase domain-containing protein [Verrucomicrobiota bacterium]|nr:penicillin-binding transpeptidase domain-containing protein [Verrucomicrobiota bacterium]
MITGHAGISNILLFDFQIESINGLSNTYNEGYGRERELNIMTLGYRLRFYLVGLILIAGLSALLIRLFVIQINRYDEFSSKVPGTSEVKVRVPGVRGIIRDRRGRVLVENVARYEMQFNLKEILNNYRIVIKEENLAISKSNRDATVKKDLKKVPVSTFNFNDGTGIKRTRKEEDMVAIVSEIIFPYLANIGLYREFHAGDLQRHWRTHGGLVPYTYRDDLTFEEYAIAAEHSLDLPGVTVAARPMRKYVYGALASHILGFVRQPDIKKVPSEERKAWEYYVPDDFGGDGIEETMDDFLRGRPGQRVMLKDEKGRVVDSKDEEGKVMGEISYDPPKRGSDVWLTLDLRYQYIAEQALRKVGRGAVVVVAPTSYKTKLKDLGKEEEHWIHAGDILAMASVPSYDPNKFIPSISEQDWKMYLDNENDPLINRALKDHAPGSTFKIPVSLAGMLSDTEVKAFECAGGAGYGPKVFMKCWARSKGYTHGSIFVRGAIKTSCNGFFYRYGNATGIENILKVSKWMGLGTRSGIPLNNEDPGFVPSPQWKRVQGLGNWGAADTAQVSIGQGATEATPLQMAMVASTIANGGKYYRPRLIHRTVGEAEEKFKPSELQYDLTELGIPAEKIEICRSGMYDVVNELRGTARRGESKIVKVSGKTGTAQTGRKRPTGTNETNAWFISFAPYDKPKLAVCVMVENGKAGGTVCAPIAKRIIDEIMSVEQFNFNPQVSPVKESEGNFDFVELVSFDDDPTEAFVGDDDGEDGTAVAATPAPDLDLSVRKAPVIPTVKKAPDTRGSVKTRTVRQRIGILDRRGRRR